MADDTMSGLTDWLKGQGSNLLGGLGDTASTVGKNAPMLALLYLMGQYMNKQQNKNYGTDPYGGAVSDIKGQQTAMTDKLNTQTSGATSTNPNVAAMRTMLMNRASTPQLTAPTVDAPARFNPYANGGTGAGGADTDLMTKMKGMVMNPSTGNQGGMDNLQNSLNQRFGTRAQQSYSPSGRVSGALTPAGQPQTSQPAQGTMVTPTSGQLTPQQYQQAQQIFQQGGGGALYNYLKGITGNAGY